MMRLAIPEKICLVRTLSPRGYQIAQCSNAMEMGESVPDFKSTPVSYEHLLHEQAEKVLFLCMWGGFDHLLGALVTVWTDFLVGTRLKSPQPEVCSPKSPRICVGEPLLRSPPQPGPHQRLAFGRNQGWSRLRKTGFRVHYIRCKTAGRPAWRP
jgi:hypothetical protein